MKKIVAILVLVIGVLIVLLLTKDNTSSRVQNEDSSSKAEHINSDLEAALRKENQQLTDEVALLRKGQRELIRLRGEVGVLRNQSQQALAGTHTQMQSQEIATNEVVSVSETNNFSTNTYTVNAKAKVGNGQTLIAGGWQITPGKRYYMLVTPQLSVDDKLARVQVNTLFVEGPDNLLTDVGLDFGPAGRDSFASRVMESGQSEALINKLLSTEGVDVLTTPDLTTLSGRNAMINAAEVKSASDEEKPAFQGPIVQITPTLSEDGQSIELQVTGQITREGL